MEDFVTKDVDYGQLDRPWNPVRPRLCSTVLRVLHDGDPATAQSVTATYAYADGQPRAVAARNVVLDCWHRVIRHLTDGLPPEQAAAMNDQQKVPLLYTDVQLRNWEALEALGIDGVRARGTFQSGFKIDFPVSMGSYRFADMPSEPVLLRFCKVLVEPGLPSREQALAGKRQFMGLSFDDLEISLRDHLPRTPGPGRFDATRDAKGITVNRQFHG